MARYDNTLANFDLSSHHLSYLCTGWELKENLPHIFDANGFDGRRLMPRVRENLANDLVACGLPESSLDDPKVQNIISLAVGSVYSHGVRDYEYVLTRRMIAPFDEDGTRNRAFVVRVIGALALYFLSKGRSYDDVAEYLNDGARTKGLDRLHVRRAAFSYARAVRAKTRADGVNTDGWFLMDAVDVAALGTLQQRAKQLPGLAKLKGVALANGIAEKYDFQEQFALASQERFAWPADAEWRKNPAARRNAHV
ncbi:MAG: hypothetical protein AB7U61_16425 [Methylocystis sp.]